MIAAIYARVSTKDKGQDPENQLRELREYCARANWTVYAEYVDHTSGKSGDRDAFKRMFEDAAQRRFNVVLAWSLDRMTREGIPETFEHLRELKTFGVDFESYKEPHFRTTGPAGELLLAVAAWIAKQERERLRERVAAGMRRAKADGKEIGRPRRIFSREEAAALSANGKSVRQVAKLLGISRSTAARAIRDAATDDRPKMPGAKTDVFEGFLQDLATSQRSGPI